MLYGTTYMSKDIFDNYNFEHKKFLYYDSEYCMDVYLCDGRIIYVTRS